MKLKVTLWPFELVLPCAIFVCVLQKFSGSVYGQLSSLGQLEQ